ncbi:MAG: ketol-acid reductoisomerase [Deltaproteobacteria bacterium]|nr:ketol-acid reductoisomerase [Deltaproteobacteria bacterium]MBN2670261.1 ketol-acid reductoisomerase [Deltaproteobacteria bacterium]
MPNNYFNTLSMKDKLKELGQCRLMSSAEFSGIDALKDRKIVIVGCGAQGLNQGLNLRDSGLDVSYALRAEAIAENRPSYRNAVSHQFACGTIEELIPTADLVANLTPDKQHTPVVLAIMPLMKPGAALLYSHGFNIVEEGMQIRDDITVVMVAPKSPGSEVRQEYLRGFGVPTLIAVHRNNDPLRNGFEIAKAYCCGTGGDRAGVLASSFAAEVKSDLMGEQTILCGMLQTGAILCYDKMRAAGIDESYASTLVQYGFETITEAMKQGGLTLMMDRLSNPAKIRAAALSETLKEIVRPLFDKHMADIIDGTFSATMMADWQNNDADLLRWRQETGETGFEKAKSHARESIAEQTYFDHGILMVAMVKAGVELAYEAMTAVGILPASAYYESLHETPLIANTIARKKLHEMNVTISDTAEYGNYLFFKACRPLLKDFMNSLDTQVIGAGLNVAHNGVNNAELRSVNESIRNHPIEAIGTQLRSHMNAMKAVV